MKPLFIWAGGKNKMIKKYQSFFPGNNFINYYEPFLGGGAVFIYIYRYYLNDANPNIMSIYNSIKNDYDNFISTLERLSNTYLEKDKPTRKEYYYQVRHQHAWEFQNWKPAEEAATLYFLMKTGFNGIWQINKNTNNRYGTPCGLLNQKRVYDPDNLDQWHEVLQTINLTCKDFRKIRPRKNSLIYLDPPYRGGFTKYGTGFNDDDQAAVIDFMKKNSHNKVMMSNRDLGDGFFEERLEDGMKITYFDVTYTAGRRKRVEGGFEAKKTREILITNC